MKSVKIVNKKPKQTKQGKEGKEGKEGKDTRNRYSKCATKYPSHNKTKKSNKIKNVKGGGWWPFSENSDITVYDKYIEKYKKQIADLQKAIKTLQDKIDKMETAKASTVSIGAEKAKIEKLTQEKNEAVKSANSGWFSGFFK